MNHNVDWIDMLIVEIKVQDALAPYEGKPYNEQVRAEIQHTLCDMLLDYNLRCEVLMDYDVQQLIIVLHDLLPSEERTHNVRTGKYSNSDSN